MITATQGEAVVSHRFKAYEPFKGEIEKRTNGSLIAIETGLAIAYSMDKLAGSLYTTTKKSMQARLWVKTQEQMTFV